MFDKTATYHKSAKGSEAIATRSAALTPKMRSMLILVDGKRGFDELARLGQMLGDPAQLLAQLAEQGLIEPPAASPAQAGGAAEATTAPAPLAAAPAATVPLREAQRFAARRLTDLLGPAAEDLCIRIEGTRNAQEFNAAVHKAEAMLRQFGGEKMAAQFAADMATHRPG